MSSGYKGGGNYRKYSAGGYRPSSYSRYTKKQRQMIRLRNRIIIVATGVIAVVLVITLFSLFLKNCLCAGCANDSKNQLPTETVDVSATEKPANGGLAGSPEQGETLDFLKPAIADTSTKKGETVGGVYIYDDTAFRPFSGDNASAEAYADAINTAKKKLGKKINVYNMILPTQIELKLPERLKNSGDGVTTNPQADYIKTAYSSLDKDVTYINGYNQLATHCNDYLYFKTDYRLTGLGGYYGYNAFATQLGLKPVNLEGLKKTVVSNFNGYYNYGNELGLKKEPIEYWESEDFNVELLITNTNGSTAPDYSCFYNVENEEDHEKIKVFHQGSFPMVKFTSGCESAKGKICIVQDDFTNAMVSYFTHHYEEVYLLDIDKCAESDKKESIKEICKKNGIKDVLFVNNTASSASPTTPQNIKDII